MCEKSNSKLSLFIFYLQNIKIIKFISEKFVNSLSGPNSGGWSGGGDELTHSYQIINKYIYNKKEK